MKLIVSLVLGSASVAGLAEKDGPAAASEKRTPLVKVSQAVPFGDNRGNEKREKLAVDIADQVRRDSRANYRISGLFESYEKQDAATLKSVKGDKNMLALIQESSRVEPAKPVAAVKKQVPIDQIQAQIDAQRQLVIDIHTPFEEKEKQDIHEFQKVRRNPNMQALLQLKKNSWDDIGTTADENIYGSSSSSSSSSSSEGAFGTKSFDWRKLSDEIAESAKENGLSDSVASATTTADDDVASSSVASTETSTDSVTSNMDEMNRYIAKFSVDNPADVPKKMNPSDFTQDFHHSSNYGGSVISIPLSSQLQVSTSFLQQKLETKIAPGVEDEVAKEKKWDVYLADGFRAQEVRDEEEVKRMKGRKEYGE